MVQKVASVNEPLHNFEDYKVCWSYDNDQFNKSFVLSSGFKFRLVSVLRWRMMKQPCTRKSAFSYNEVLKEPKSLLRHK